MKTKAILPIVLILVSLSFACSKDETTDPVKEIPLIDTVYNYRYNGPQGIGTSTTIFNYDDNGRLILSYRIGNPVYRLVISYKNDSFYYDNKVASFLSFHIKGKMNSDWSEKSSVIITKMDENSESTISTSTYNSNGFLLQQLKITGARDTSYYSIEEENGNIVYKANSNLVNGVETITSVEDYEFYTDKENTIGNKNMGLYFEGADNKNLVKKKTETREGHITITNLTYEFDDLNRVYKQIEIKNASDTMETVYSYKN